MELLLIVNFLECTNLLMVMQKKLLFIELKIDIVRKSDSYISLQMYHILLKQQETVCLILVPIVAHASCGIVDFLSYGQT